MSSQAGQDVFVQLMLPHGKTFVDVGCNLPIELNNTHALEKAGWTGVSLDINDFSSQWSDVRKTKFVQEDALKCDYRKLFTDNNLESPIDYLNLDIEGNGHRFKALKKIMESGYEFKIITIEHDAYRGQEHSEREPQREFLKSKKYRLLCGNVCFGNVPFEDWYIKPEYFTNDRYKRIGDFVSDGQRHEVILSRLTELLT